MKGDELQVNMVGDLRCYGIHLPDSNSWLENDDREVFWTVSRSVAEVQLQALGERFIDASVREFGRWEKREDLLYNKGTFRRFEQAIEKLTNENKVLQERLDKIRSFIESDLKDMAYPGFSMTGALMSIIAVLDGK